MSTIRSPELGPYRRGQLASIPCSEPDPFPDWATITERDAHDMRSIYLDGKPVAAFGYIPVTRRKADAFAVIDRQACKGIGADLARITHNQIRQWMQHTGIIVADASCSAHDRAAQVFLRAAGFRKVRTTADTAHFTFIWR